jgi:hypothetical protein
MVMGVMVGIAIMAGWSRVMRRRSTKRIAKVSWFPDLKNYSLVLCTRNPAESFYLHTAPSSSLERRQSRASGSAGEGMAVLELAQVRVHPWRGSAWPEACCGAQATRPGGRGYGMASGSRPSPSDDERRG